MRIEGQTTGCLLGQGVLTALSLGCLLGSILITLVKVAWILWVSAVLTVWPAVGIGMLLGVVVEVLNWNRFNSQIQLRLSSGGVMSWKDYLQGWLKSLLFSAVVLAGCFWFHPNVALAVAVLCAYEITKLGPQLYQRKKHFGNASESVVVLTPEANEVGETVQKSIIQYQESRRSWKTEEEDESDEVRD